MIQTTPNRIFLDVVERHADEAAFLWEQRERAARSPIFDRAELQGIDDRIEANLEGLALAGPDGLRIAMRAFDRAARTTLGPDGELFAASHLAVELADNVALARLLAFAQQAPRHERAFVSALSWLPAAHAERVVSELLAAECPPLLHRFGIAAREARREDPGAALDRALRSDDAELRAAACRAAGRLGRRDLLRELRLAAGDPADPARGWAAWAAVLLGDASFRDVLWAVAAQTASPAEDGSPAKAASLFDGAALSACDLAARASAPTEAADLLAALAGSDQTLPVALAGAAARGDPASLGWVLDVIERVPALARRAAWVYATITGAKLESPLFVRAPSGVPSGVPADSELAQHLGDPHRDVPQPALDALRAHWAAARPLFRDGERYLGGKPMDAAWLRECLRDGPQPWRASAALELQRAGATERLFPVLARGRAQLTHG